MVRPLVVLLAALLLPLGAGAADKMNRVPIVKRTGTPGLMIQTGWHRYKAEDGMFMLFCTPEKTAATLTCAVFLSTGKSNAVVFLEGIVSSEANT
jgi:hypothetical protein